MKFKEKLEKYFHELIDEFELENNFNKAVNKRFNFIIREVFIPDKNINFDRYSKDRGYSSKSYKYFDTSIFNELLVFYIKDSIYFEKIYTILKDNYASPFKIKKTINDDINSMPSITRNYISGFLSRYYYLKINEQKTDNNAFSQTFKELMNFITADTFTFKTLINLKGITGIIKELKISDNISIKKADNDIVKLFALQYNDITSNHIEIFENDYYLEIKHELDKNKFYKINSIENTIMKEVYESIIVSSFGNIELGNTIREGNSWVLILNKKTSFPQVIIDKYNYTNNKFIFSISSTIGKSIIKNYKIIKNIDTDTLHHNIKSSFSRLKKAKTKFEIEDRIIELAIALEFLINTNSYEVSLQLKLKILSLCDDYDKDELFNLTTEFYKLRGDVMHGNKPIKLIAKNINTIEKIEIVIGRILVKFIIYSQEYSYKNINKAITQSLYKKETINEILKTYKN